MLAAIAGVTSAGPNPAVLFIIVELVSAIVVAWRIPLRPAQWDIRCISASQGDSRRATFDIDSGSPLLLAHDPRHALEAANNSMEMTTAYSPVWVIGASGAGDVLSGNIAKVTGNTHRLPRHWLLGALAPPPWQR